MDLLFHRFIASILVLCLGGGIGVYGCDFKKDSFAQFEEKIHSEGFHFSDFGLNSPTPIFSGDYGKIQVSLLAVLNPLIGLSGFVLGKIGQNGSHLYVTLRVREMLYPSHFFW